MTHRLRRMAALIALFTLMGTLIVACGGGGGGAEGTAPTAATGGNAGTTATEGAAPTTAAAETVAPVETMAAAETMAPAETMGAAETMAPAETMGAAETMAAETASPEETMAAGTAEAETASPAETAAGGDTGTAAAPAMTLPADCTNVELAYWNPFTGPDQPFMQELVDSFNAANPNIQVAMTAQATYNEQLGTAAASDTLPDVAIINEDRVATEAFRNIIRPMDDVVTQMGLSEADFPAVAWNAGKVGDTQYAIPLSFVAMTMYYNQDLLTAAGLDAPPTNREEFEAAAQAMTAEGNNGFMITSGFPVQQIFQQLLHQFGGSEFSEDGTKATWNSEAGVQALTWMRDAQTNYSQPALEVDAELNAFKSGTVGMVWNGSWQIPNLTGEAVEFSGQVAPVPQIGDQPAVWAGGPLLALPVHKSGNDACKDAGAAIFIRYLIDNSAQWARGGNIPAFNAAREDPVFTALPQAALATSVENPVFPPSVPGIGDAFGPLSEAVSAVMLGTATDVKAALDESATRADVILADNKANYGDAPAATP